jgi:hypothetical protein
MVRHKINNSKTPKGEKNPKNLEAKNFDVLLRRLTVKSDAKYIT